MSAENARTIIGLDLHSVKVQLYVADWINGVEDRANARWIETTRDKLAETYEKHIRKPSMTVIEASSGTFSIVRELRKLGYDAKAVKPDTVSKFERKDHVNDKTDAMNLAKAEAADLTHEVFTPSPEFEAYRSLPWKYRNSNKDCTRSSNRIWNFCSNLNIELPPRDKNLKIGMIENVVEKSGLSDLQKLLLKEELDVYKAACAARERIEELMAKIVAKNEMMPKVMQITGIAAKTAFAVVTYIEDIGRFKSAGKLSAYFGLNPVLNESGNGKSPRRTSHFGVRYVKGLLTEGAQKGIGSGHSSMHAWARRKLMQDKQWNLVVTALARKMTVAIWHIMNGDYAPDENPRRHIPTSS